MWYLTVFVFVKFEGGWVVRLGWPMQPPKYVNRLQFSVFSPPSWLNRARIWHFSPPSWLNRAGFWYFSPPDWLNRARIWRFLPPSWLNQIWLTYFGGFFRPKSNRLTYFGGGFRPNPRRLTYFGGQQQRRPPTPPRQQKRTLLPGSFYQGGRIVQNQYGIDGRDSFSFTSRVCQHRRFPRLAVKPDALYLKIRTMRFSRLVSQHYSPSGPNCQKAYRRSRARRRLIRLQPASWRHLTSFASFMDPNSLSRSQPITAPRSRIYQILNKLPRRLCTMLTLIHPVIKVA